MQSDLSPLAGRGKKAGRRLEQNKTAHLAVGGLECFALLAMTSVAVSALRRVVRRGRAGAVLGHEGVELFLVPGVAQAVEEIAEFDLLLFQPAQRVGAIFVEGAGAGRRRGRRGNTALPAAAPPPHLVP